MKKTKYALLVIDMQQVAFDGKITPPIVNGPRLLKRISNLIDICRADGIPIVFLQTCALPGQPYAKDTHGWEIHSQVFPELEDQVVFKANSSGFDDTTLQKVLRELGTEGVITCGIWSEGCVAATSLSAIQLGFEVCVVADGHGTVADSEQGSADVISSQNKHLAQRDAQVMSIKDIEENLQGTGWTRR